MRGVVSFLKFSLLASSASFAVAACGDDGGGSVTAEELAALCTQFETKVAACTTPPAITVDCTDGVPASCRSQMAAMVSCYNAPTVDICGDAAENACESQLGAALQCAFAFCGSNPNDPACQ
jgi:hypothetical protein